MHFCIRPAVHRSIYHDLPNGRYVSIRISFLSVGNVSLLPIIICVCKPLFFYLQQGQRWAPCAQIHKSSKEFHAHSGESVHSCFIFLSFSHPTVFDPHFHIYLFKNMSWMSGDTRPVGCVQLLPGTD